MNLLLMHSSTSFAPETDSANEMSLALADDTVAETAEVLSSDEVAIVFGFLSHVDDIMRARVCTTWREAAKKTIVPLCELRVDSVSVRSYNAMRVMATALPNFQQLKISYLGLGNKYVDGEDPDEENAQLTDSHRAHDINIISNFRKLRILVIKHAPLNGRYPVLFNFQLIQKLSISHCLHLKFDLDMLVGLRLLKEIDCVDNPYLIGNLRSLRSLKHTLEKVKIVSCFNIMGKFMDLADFPCLKELDLRCTQVTGDMVRDIGEDDFPVMETLVLPDSVRCGVGCTFQNISEVPSFMHTIHPLLQRAPTLFSKFWLTVGFHWSLSEDSPDWYDFDRGFPKQPFGLQLIQAGSRLGWRWCNYDDLWTPRDKLHSCEINWLDPEPSSESDDYEAYIEALQRIEGELNTDFYRGYHEPPTEMEYRRLCEGLEQRD